jgi:hypothetical protein
MHDIHSSAGICDLGKELRSAIPSAVCLSDAAAGARTAATAPPPTQPAVPPNVPHSVLGSFAAAHGVEPGSILGGQKRGGGSHAPSGSVKRPCTSPDRGEACGGSQGSHDAVLAGMAAARRGAPAKSALSLLAEQLEGGVWPRGSQSQAATQMLQLTQGRLPALAPQPLPPVAAGDGRVTTGARHRRQAQRATQEIDKVPLVLYSQHTLLCTVFILIQFIGVRAIATTAPSPVY